MRGKKYTDQDLLDMIVELSDELTKKKYKDLDVSTSRRTRVVPTAKQMKEAREYPCPGTYLKRFGSWDLAKYLVGFDDEWKYSTDEYIDMLTEQTGFSRGYVASLFDGLERRKNHIKNDKKRLF